MPNKRTTVSIVTISQLSRHKCLLNLYELIKLQDYKNIIEWIIVEGSKTKMDADKNKINIENFIKTHKESTKNQENNQFTNSIMNIIYIEHIENANNRLSDLRNISNNMCSGDIIICMDDDDYYPVNRVSHAVNKLEKSNKLIAGCSDIYIYEYFMEQLYKCKRYGKNHSTNNCMAYKREYLENHMHKPGLDMAEEASFTNGFTEPMIQLDSKKCIIVSSHNHNTYDKKPLCMSGTLGVNRFIHEVNGSSIIEFIPKEIIIQMREFFIEV